jgi:hypothetical protein
MSDEQTRSLLLVVLGATATWLWWSGDVLNYVRPGLAPYLLASGVILVGLGLLPPLGLLGDQAAAGLPGRHQREQPGPDDERQPAAVLLLCEPERRQDGRARVGIPAPELVDLLLERRRLHRSTSPMTPSSDPTIAIRSATAASRMHVAVASPETGHPGPPGQAVG